MQYKAWRKRLISLFMIVTLAETSIMSIFNNQVLEIQAATTTWTDENEVTWNYEVKTSNNQVYAEIKSVQASMSITNLTIPAMINDYPTSIGYGAFKENKTLQSVTIEGNGEKIIASDAFKGCTALKKVNFSSDFTSLNVGSYVFDNCTALESMVIPCDTTMSVGVFAGCTRMENMIFKGKTEFNGRVFTTAFGASGNGSKKVTFEKKVTMNAMEGGAFQGCIGIDEIEFCDDVEFCEYAFAYASNLKKITFGGAISRRSYAAFDGCDLLKTIEFRGSAVDWGMFFQCDGGKELKVDNIIFKEDVVLDQWGDFCDGAIITFEAGVKVTKEMSIKVKEMIFYDSSVRLEDIEKLTIGYSSNSAENTGGKAKIYGIGKSSIEKLAKKENNEAEFFDIVQELTLTEGYKSIFFVKSGDIQSITPEDLGLKLKATYYGYPNNRTELLSYQGSNVADNNLDYTKGYVLEYGTLKNTDTTGIVNQIRIKYSNYTPIIMNDIQVKNRSVSSLDVKLVDGAEFIAGIPISKDKLIVTATYNTNDVEVLDNSAYTITQDKLVVGNNTIMVEYGGVKKQLENITAVNRSLTKIEATYEGSDVTVGTRVNVYDINVTAYYDNGTVEENVKFSFVVDAIISKIGDNKIVITYDGKYTDVVVQGVANVQVTGSKVVPTTNCAIVGTTIPESFFSVEEIYNNGETKKVANAKVQVAPHEIKLGSGNTVFVTYNGVQYPIDMIGIENGIVSITAKYVGEATSINDSIHLKDIQIKAVYKDGTVKIHTADTVLGCFLAEDSTSANKKVVKYFNLEAEVLVENTPTATSGAIVAGSISRAKISLVSTKIYTSAPQAIKPKVVVKYNGKKLQLSKDYTVSYKNNNGFGKGTVMIKGKGIYTGKKSLTFQILPDKVKITKCKQVYLKKKKAVRLDWKKQTGVAGYQVVYATSKLKKYKELIRKGMSDPTTTFKLNRTVYIKIRSYIIVDGKMVYGKYSKVKKVNAK